MPTPTMLAVATSDALVLVDGPSLKKPPPSLPPTATFLSQPTAIAWANDNTSLFLSLPDAIEKYDPAGTHLDTVYSTSDPVAALVAIDKGDTLIFSILNEIIVLESHSRKVAHKFTSHRHNVVALALSNDATLLASVSSNAIHVHNLSLASHTILRGFPSGTISTCEFHPHTRTRLLLGIGLHFVIYDTTRTSGPTRTCTLDKGAGDIVAISCSPYSKTLVAVACSGGSVSLVDLEKEPGVFRTVNLQVPLTSLIFSPEGAALYTGTDNGKVLILDLRALDKPPKTISVSGTGQRIVSMSVQKKLRPGPKHAKSVDSKATERESEPSKKPTRRIVSASGVSLSPTIKRTASSSSLSKNKPNDASPLMASPVQTRPRTTMPPSTSTSSSRLRASSSPGAASSSAKPSPMRARTISSTTSGSSRVTTSSRQTIATSRTSLSSGSKSPAQAIGKAFSPPKSPLSRSVTGGGEVSVQVGNLLSLPKARVKRSIGTTDAEDDQMLSTASRVSTSNHPARVRTRTMSSTSARSRTSSSRAMRSGTEAKAGKPGTSASAAGTAASTLLPASGDAASSILPSASSNRPTHAKKTSSVSSVSIPVPHVNISRTGSPSQDREEEQLTAIRLSAGASRTPSPELEVPPAGSGPLAGVKSRDKGKGKGREKLDVLGLGTPEVRRWVAAGELSDVDDEGRRRARAPQARRVGFLEPEPDPEPESEVQIQSIEVVGVEEGRHLRAGGDADEATRTVRMTVQISPRRPPAPPSSSSGLAPSPLGPAHALPALNLGAGAGQTGAGAAGTSPAHDLLHAIIRDALHDFRRETKAEIIGLHLDLVKMGRGWRKEMERWGVEMREVLEENRRLKDENDRLRRGY